MQALATIVDGLREQRPLVHCLTNYVSMDVAANVLLAAGASPAMVHAEPEVEEFAGLASAVSVNIGTLSPPWVAAMHTAARTASQAGTPWVLDPVAVGATTYRQRTATDLMGRSPTVVRANSSEVLALTRSVVGGRGVDSTATVDEAVEAAHELATRARCVVAMTGQTDLVVDGRRTVRVAGGDPSMPLVTALGCSASALVAACCAVHSDPLEAAVAALALMAVAGGRAGEDAAGPGSLRWRLLDELAGLDGATVAARADLS